MTPRTYKGASEEGQSFAPPMAPACGLSLARVHYGRSRKWAAGAAAREPDG